MSAKITYLAKNSDAYLKLGLKKGIPESWEDGMRTNGGKGSYEWWYFDAHLQDGSKMVIVFYTKAITDINKPLAAYATLNIDFRDGTKFERYLPSLQFSAANDKCDVQIGECYFRGNMAAYNIHLEGQDFKLDVEFHNQTQSWRPETGHYYFGDKGYYFAWLVAIPKGYAKINYQIGREKFINEGGCYHDHNWGNRAIYKLINHWYWSRSELGPYMVIASQIVPEKKYGYEPVHIVGIFKNSKIVADNADNLQLTESNMTKGVGGKPIANELTFSYHGDVQNYSLHLIRSKNILETYLIQQEFQRKLAKLLTGFNGAYFRITGEAKLEVHTNGELTECLSTDDAIWELMYFGKPA